MRDISEVKIMNNKTYADPYKVNNRLKEQAGIRAEIAALDAKIAAIKSRIKRLKKKLEGEKC